MSYLYGMGYVTCVLWVKRKLVRLINFLTWVDLFPLSLNLARNYSWTGLNRRQRKLSKVGFKKLNLILPTIHDMYKLFKKWFLIRSIKWLFISILFSIPPFIFQAKKPKGKKTYMYIVALIRIPLTKFFSRKHLRCETWLPQAENGQGKKFFKVRKKSSQGKFQSLKEVKKKWNFKTLWGDRALSLLSGLICAIANSVGQRNFTFVRK